MPTITKKLTPDQIIQLQAALTQLPLINGQLEEFCDQHEQLVMRRTEERSGWLTLASHKKFDKSLRERAGDREEGNRLTDANLIQQNGTLLSYRRQLVQLERQIRELRTKQDQLQKAIIKGCTLEEVAQLRIKGVLK